MNGVLYLFKYAWKFQRKYIFYALIQEILSSVIPLTLIILPKYIIDELLGSQNIKLIIIYTVTMIACNFATAVICSWLRKHCFVLKGKLFVDFQEMISNRLSKCDYEKLEDPSFLDVKEKAKKFLYANGQGFGEVMDQAFNILGNAVRFVGIIFIVVNLSVKVVVVLVILVLINAVIEGKLKDVSLDMEKAPVERRTNYLISVIEDFSYGKEIRLLDVSEWFSKNVRHYLNISQNFYKKQMSSINKSQYIAGITNLLQELFTYSFLIVRVLQKMISIGDFTMYLSAINSFSSSMNDLMKSCVEIKQFEGYYGALKEYLDVPITMNTGSYDVPEAPYEIEFKNVSFRYPGQTEWSLKNINVKISDNKKYSIVGENGAGKTTFIKLLCRLYDPTEGQILLNGTDIREYDYSQYMHLFSTVFQDYKLFSFSIKDNIAFGETEEDARVIEVLKKSGFGDKLNALEKGIHSYIHKDFEEDGFEPSGGEGQKIALARALYQDRPVIILDEPTSALDPKAEYTMYKNFNSLVEGKLTLYISHRMSSSRFCDYVLVFSDGAIIEEGTHEELMKLKKVYSSLYSMQAQFYLD